MRKAPILTTGAPATFAVCCEAEVSVAGSHDCYTGRLRNRCVMRTARLAIRFTRKSAVRGMRDAVV